MQDGSRLITGLRDSLECIEGVLVEGVRGAAVVLIVLSLERVLCCRLPLDAFDLGVFWGVCHLSRTP